MLQNKRSTGRTTKMLNRACKNMLSGKTVGVIVPTHQLVKTYMDYCEKRLQEKFRYSLYNVNIKKEYNLYRIKIDNNAKIVFFVYGSNGFHLKGTETEFDIIEADHFILDRIVGGGYGFEQGTKNE